MLVYWIWYTQLPNMTGREKMQLLERYSDPKTIYDLDVRTMEKEGKLPDKVVNALADKDLAEAKKIMAVCRRKDIGILSVSDSAYPRKLKNISDAPLVLYYKGELPDFDAQPLIGVVGTRKATAYGMQVARNMAREMADCGLLVVSGCAVGIDSAAMQGALDAGSRVIGVLGCGIDMVYPKTARKLYMQTEQAGCLISEYAPGTKPNRWNFPRRNRIISGISDGVLVVEAPEKSGALITAECALEQGRDVFAVPGNIGVTACAGSNDLLRDGAMVACSGWDVAREYELRYPGVIKPLSPRAETAQIAAQRPAIPAPSQTEQNKKSIDNPAMPLYSKTSETDMSPDEKAVFRRLGPEPMLVDDLVAEVDMPTARVLTILTMLTMRNIVVNHPGRRVSIRRNLMSGGNER